MIIYDINSWHYRLILWSWGVHFFETSRVDWKSYQALDSSVMAKMPYNELPLKYESKTVNFCPYCRAILGSVLCAPFVYLWRLFPHKSSKPRTREEIMKASARRSLIPLLVGSGINIGFGIKNISFGMSGADFYAGIIQIGLGVGMLLGWYYREKIGKNMINVLEWINKHRKPKVKVTKTKVDKPPSKIRAKLSKHHDTYCPPVHFIDKSKDEKYI